MTLTHYGLREWGLALIGMLAVWVGAWYLSRWTVVGAVVLAVLALLFFIGVAGFFRNPKRRIPEDPLLLLSAADGVVRDINLVTDMKMEPFDEYTGDVMRIGIFLSVLNVHVNRAPFTWQIMAKNYRPGEYLDARNSECAKRNEAMTLSGMASLKKREFPLAVRQISGAIARRIVCPVDPGRVLRRGEIYGMIKFGSRTEIYLPATDDIKIMVKVGDIVRAGETVIAELAAAEAR